MCVARRAHACPYQQLQLRNLSSSNESLLPRLSGRHGIVNAKLGWYEPVGADANRQPMFHPRRYDPAHSV